MKVQTFSTNTSRKLNLDNSAKLGDAICVEPLRCISSRDSWSNRLVAPYASCVASITFEQDRMNILLLGPRASGKTTIGRLLSQRTGMKFVDLDERTLAGLGLPTVRDVWQKMGETAWRAAEVHALKQVLTNDNQIVSLGGGTPTIPEARTMIEAARASACARTVYLRCATDELVRRLSQAAGDRPSLTGKGPADEVMEVLSKREPTYLAIADIVCDTADQSLQETLAELLTLLKR
jgi:shikimate kinase